MTTKDSVSKELEKVLRKSEAEIGEKDRLVREKTLAYEAIKEDSDATIQALRDQNMQASSMNERLFHAREVLERERNELSESLTKKMKESLRLEA